MGVLSTLGGSPFGVRDISLLYYLGSLLSLDMSMFSDEKALYRQNLPNANTISTVLSNFFQMYNLVGRNSSEIKQICILPTLVKSHNSARVNLEHGVRLKPRTLVGIIISLVSISLSVLSFIFFLWVGQLINLTHFYVFYRVKLRFILRILAAWILVCRN